MKKLLLFAVAVVSYAAVSAQCTPNATTGSPYVSPPTDSLDCVVQGVAYSETIQFELPEAQPPVVNSGTVTFDSILNIPCGIGWTPNAVGGTYNLGESGCFTITGTSTDNPGQYLLEIYITVVAQTPLGPQTFSGRADDVIADIEAFLGPTGIDLEYYLRVTAPGDPCPALDRTNSNNLTAQDVCPAFTATIIGDNAACEGDSVTLHVSAPLAVAPLNYLWSTGATTDSVRVEAGSSVNVRIIDATPDTVTTNFTVLELFAPEASFTYTVSNDTVTVTSTSTNSPSTIGFTFDTLGSAATGTASYAFGANGTYDITLVAANDCGTDDTTVTVNITGVGIGGPEAQGIKFSVYPNPGKGNFNVSLVSAHAGLVDVTVFGLQGQAVYATTANVHIGTNTVALPLNGVAAGVYFVRISNTSGAVVRKLVVE